MFFDVLYHGTVNEFDFKIVPYLWTTPVVKQSALHVFESLCKRYVTNARYTNRKLWPLIYEIKLQRDLKLLNITLIDTKYFVINDKGIYDIPLEQFFIDQGVDFDVSFGDIPPTDKCYNEYSKECNIKILMALKNLKIYDGYMCINDQNEVAIINPSEKLVIKNIYFLDGIILENMNSVTLYMDNTQHSNYNSFIEEYYNNVKERIGIETTANIPINNSYNLTEALSNLKMRLFKEIRIDNIDNAQKRKQYFNIVKENDFYFSYDDIIQYCRECFNIINIQSNLSTLTPDIKDIIYRYFLCFKDLVRYNMSTRGNFMEAKEPLKLLFVDKEGREIEVSEP